MLRLCRIDMVGLTLLVVLAAGVTAHGQGRREGGSGGGGMRGMGGMGGQTSISMLLRSDQVLQELKLTDDQKARVRELGEKRRAEMMSLFSNMGNLSAEERRAKMNEMREKMQKESETREAAYFKQIAEILKPEQVMRLKQIQLQQEGPAALRRPEIAEAIGLTAEQKQKLEQVATEAREAGTKLFQEMFQRTEGQDREAREKRREELRQQSQKLREESEQKSMAILTSEQKQQLKEIFGEPFELDRSQLFPSR
ncbi:MAG: Spy/CpxP family protein refolding chaperone, partial [Thermoguttaceae bacterium]